MSRITLPERCDRGAAQTLLPEFVALLGSGPVEIDGSRVAQIGQAMLQLLVSARASFEHSAISASPALRDAAELAGLSRQLFNEGQP